MAISPVREGKIPFKIPSIDTECFTSYKIFGELEERKQPALVVVHGGPGGGHEYLLPFAQLWPLYDIPVVFYDQVGCGASTHLRQTAGNRDIWRAELFERELENLLDHLRLHDGLGFHLYGQSFGGRVVVPVAARRPKGLQRLILANANSSTELAIRGTEIRRKELPLEIQQGLDKAERERDYEGAGYKNAQVETSKRFLIRTSPVPEEMLAAYKHLSDDRTVYSTMMGPSHLTVTGTLLGQTCIPDLPKISATTLVYNGEFDSSHDISNVPFFELIPKVRWVTFADAAHMCHLEGRGIREKVLKTVGDFLVPPKYI